MFLFVFPKRHGGAPPEEGIKNVILLYGKARSHAKLRYRSGFFLRPQMLEGLLHLLGDFLRYADRDRDQVIPASRASEMRHALAADTEHLARLGAGRDFHIHRSVDRLDGDARTECQIRIRERGFCDHVVTAPAETDIRTHMHHHEKVSGRSSKFTCGAAAGKRERLPILDAGRDRYFDRFFLLHSARSMAGVAALRIHFPAAMAALAFGYLRECSEDGLGGAADLSGPLAGRTSLLLAPRLAAGTMTDLTARLLAKTHLLFHPRYHFGEMYLHVYLDIRTARTSSPPGSSPASENIGKDIFEAGPSEIEALAGESAPVETARTLALAVPALTELVILVPFLRVREHLVRLVYLFEFFLVAVPFVRVVLMRQFAERLLDFVLARTLGNP